ncbi:MAG TPA: ADP-ribosylglycohydrolase [Porphyromonadaceae bacterium]|nr:ADP-ribosylglycohydrolase [Porphyromonadaceae bacterium]
MLGAIIGDIIGSRWEFNPTNNYNFKLFSNKNNFTDDTICTVAVSDAILHRSDDYGGFIHKWCRRYPYPMGGYGGRFANWVESNNPQPYGSFGNGSAMRVSPIGWMSNTLEELFSEAEKSAICTHNHKEGIRGAQAVVYAIRDCRILHNEMKGKEITEEDILRKGINRAVMLYYKRPQDFKIDISKCINKFDETCQGTVPVALWIVQHSKNFEDAIRQAVSLGADADTLGAITGSIAEALWDIPEFMKEKSLSYLPKDMKTIVAEFYQELKRKSIS